MGAGVLAQQRSGPDSPPSHRWRTALSPELLQVTGPELLRVQSSGRYRFVRRRSAGQAVSHWRALESLSYHPLNLPHTSFHPAFLDAEGFGSNAR
eukprot:2496938-Amphidinium_carterae.1